MYDLKHTSIISSLHPVSQVGRICTLEDVGFEYEIFAQIWLHVCQNINLEPFPLARNFSFWLFVKSKILYKFPRRVSALLVVVVKLLFFGGRRNKLFSIPAVILVRLRFLFRLPPFLPALPSRLKIFHFWLYGYGKPLLSRAKLFGYQFSAVLRGLQWLIQSFVPSCWEEGRMSRAHVCSGEEGP